MIVVATAAVVLVVLVVADVIVVVVAVAVAVAVVVVDVGFVVIVDGVYRAISDDVTARVFFRAQHSNRRQDDASRKFSRYRNARRVVVGGGYRARFCRLLLLFCIARGRRRRRRNARPSGVP